ncbi:MAG: fibro-slime domain-containing protein, partial [Nitrosopumilaceae archaeon]
SQSSDDAEQKENGAMDLVDKSDLDIAENQIGLRFQNINIPQGSIITKAYIQFTAEDDEDDSASVKIFAENVDNAKTFSKTKFDITTRKTTQASVNWSIPEWKKQGDAGSAQRTSDVSSLVQEVVNRKDWSQGNSIAFMLLINNHGNRNAFTYDGNPGKAPLLHIEFSSGQTLKLNGLIRDFKGSHPDFEYIIGDDDGIVNSLLGGGLSPNGADPDNPAYAHTGPTKTTTGADNFNQWYKNFEDINKCKEFDITLVPSSGGLFKFSDTTFFPIDGELFGNEGRSHNYHFTYEMRGSFVSKAGQTIQVNGDDDVWIFVNHKLIYDGGGVLPPRNSGLLQLDSFGLGLVDGTEYDIDIFFAERHTVLSVFEIETNITIIQKNLSCTSKDLKIKLEEELEFKDDLAKIMKGTTYKQEFQESLNLEDTSQQVVVNGVIKLELDEKLVLDDIKFDTRRGIQIKLDDTLNLEDASQLIIVNGIIQLELSEMLELEDAEPGTTTGKSFTETLDEQLTLTDMHQIISKNGIIQLELSEMLELEDAEPGTTTGKSFTETLDEQLTLTDMHQ